MKNLAKAIKEKYLLFYYKNKLKRLVKQSQKRTKKLVSECERQYAKTRKNLKSL